jgi:hypothetical protein
VEQVVSRSSLGSVRGFAMIRRPFVAEFIAIGVTIAGYVCAMLWMR